jgi:hypothetical protein
MSCKDAAFEKTILSIVNKIGNTQFKGLDCGISVNSYTNSEHLFELKSEWKLKAVSKKTTYFGRKSDGRYGDYASIQTAVDNYVHDIESLNDEPYKQRLIEKVIGPSPCNHMDQDDLWLGAENKDFTYDYSCNNCNGHGVVSCRQCDGRGYTNCGSCDNSGMSLYGDRKSKCNACNSAWTSRPGMRRCSGCDGNTRVKCKPCSGRGGFTDHYEVAISANRINSIFKMQPSDTSPEQTSFIEAFSLSEHRSKHITILNKIPNTSAKLDTISFTTNASTLEHKANISINGNSYDTYYLGDYYCTPVDYEGAFDELVLPLLENIENQSNTSGSDKGKLFKTEAAEKINETGGDFLKLGPLAILNILSRNCIKRILNVYSEYQESLGKEMNVPVSTYVATTLKFLILILLLIIGFDAITFGEVPYGKLGIEPLYTFHTLYEFKMVSVAAITLSAILCIPAILIIGRLNKITFMRLSKSFFFGSLFIYMVMANIHYIYEFMGGALNLQHHDLKIVARDALLSIPGMLAIAPEIVCTALLFGFLRERKKSNKRVRLKLKHLNSETLKAKFNV